MQGAFLWWAILRGANLQDADCRLAVFWFANLREVNFQGADLREVILWYADLRGANLQDVKWTKESFYRDLFGAKVTAQQAELLKAQGLNISGLDVEKI